MLKLIIADDERAIRESIASRINWESLDIEVIGLCADGIEAYNMILDECPDIVMTDIRMPGLSGLDIIERVSETDMNIQFIILSGFGEFEYAKQAMKYKVHHYLLKPCNEEQIIESLRDVIKEHYHQVAFQDYSRQERVAEASFQHNLIYSIIQEYLYRSDQFSDRDNGLEPYSGFMDFYNTDYQLCYFRDQETRPLSGILDQVIAYMREHAPSVVIHSLYVKNTLILFFESYEVDYEEMDHFMKDIAEEGSSEYNRVSFNCLASLLEKLIGRIKRYDKIYFLNGIHAVPIGNYENINQKLDEITTSLINKEVSEEEGLEELKTILDGIGNEDFLKQLGENMIIKLTNERSDISPVEVAEFLMEVNQKTDISEIRSDLYEKVCQILNSQAKEGQKYSSLIDNVINYVKENLDNPNLTLKWITENYLFMNVDYVSKRFIKETGQKFSNYLTSQRIQKAKELLLEGNSDQIQWVAQQVGCGNNPQYFSQIFKKQTGMTPRAYIKKMGKE